MADERPWSRPLDEVLEIQRAGDDTFTACVGGFGGETLGCATLAATRTCESWSLHSLHTYFLRPVPTERPIQLVVERLRDGRRFAHRRVQVRSDERLLCELVASFAAPGDGVEFQDAVLGADTPLPDDLPTEGAIARAEGWAEDAPGPIGGPLEWRWIGIPWRLEAPNVPSRYRAWVRPRFALSSEHGMNAAAIAFLSDYHSHFPVARKLGGPFDTQGFTSLDQVLWLHRDLAWNDWWLLTSESDVAHAGRALTRRVLHARDGRLVASMAQEQLIPGARFPVAPV